MCSTGDRSQLKLTKSRLLEGTGDAYRQAADVCEFGVRTRASLDLTVSL